MKLRNPDYINWRITNVNFEDEMYYKHYRDNLHENYYSIPEFLLAIALCHTAIIDKNGKSCYKASSPDELSLVNAAAFFGFKFIHRDDINNLISIENP